MVALEEEIYSMADNTWVLFSVNLILVLMFILSYFTNRASNNGIFFGIRFPREYMNREELKSLENKYRVIIVIIYSILAIGFNILVAKMDFNTDYKINIFISIFTVTVLGLSALAYIPFYSRAKKLKKDNNWTYNTKNVVVTDTTLRKPKKDEKIKPISSLWFVLLMLIPFVMSIITMFKYKSLPDLILGDRIGIGTFDKNTLSGFLKLYSMIISQALIIIFLFFVNTISLGSRSDLNSGSIKKAVIRKKKFKRLASIFIFAITLCTVIMMAYFQLALLYNLEVVRFNYLYTIFMALVMMAFIIQFIKIGQGGRNIDVDEEEKDELYKDDDSKWVLGSIYFNRNDPTWMVEKRTGIGWTINFGNPKAVILFIALIALLIFLTIKSII